MSTINIRGGVPYSIPSGLAILKTFDGIIEHLSYPTEKKTSYKATKHWRAKWTSRKNGLSFCVLLPHSDAAAVVHREFYIIKWVEQYQLTEAWAEKLYDCKLPYKWENIDNIIAAFKDPNMWEAVVDYNRDGKPLYYNRWYFKWGDKVKVHLDNFKELPMKWAFINFLKDCLK
jgi:hypothetical protein